MALSAPPGFLEGVGPMGEFYRAKDWSDCELGPPESWSPQLRGYVDMMLRTPTGMIIFWGPNQIQLYNLGYSDIMGPRHPRYLGAPYKECWPDTYPTIYPLMRKVMDEGEVVRVTNALIPVTRYGFTEETYFTFSFVPLRGEGGRIEGFVQPINETTKEVLAERRLGTIQALAPRVTGGDAVAQAAAALRANPHDVPFGEVFVADERTGEVDSAARVGVDATPPRLLAIAREVARSGAPFAIADVTEQLGVEPVGPWPEPVRAAMVLPLRRAGAEGASGAIALGISPRLAFDATYEAFFEGAARELASNLTFERENREKNRLNLELQRRADALLELDRAKTAFFSNVSHEFRTPLTLMLGPVDDALADSSEPLGPAQRGRLELVRRNGGRLFKLVNTLLDFSRIEAGRSRATFEPVALAALTADLASAFRSLLEASGLSLTIECPPLPEPVWVDREMWEKIVLNLLSNAFKFTFKGGVRVQLAPEGDRVVLRVSDTGTGIAAAELPRLFERFHRVEGAKGRSYEGSGIGLALVQELARLLGGEVRVESEEGKGSTFIVSLRTGDAHVPAGRRASEAGRGAVAVAASAYVREAAGWVEAGPGARAEPSLEPELPPRDAVAPGEAAEQGHVVLADDNPDMREYVRRLLEPHYSVDGVANGLEALAAVGRRRPDLVLSDVMMPGLDGFGLLAALKGDEATRAIPVILLSARAGEEARVEGIQAGADDYLVKPFAARELLARVGARIEIARLHAALAAELERRVVERTAQLEEANRELESFSYSVSHDLRAPLRHIVGFCQLVEKSSKGNLDPKTQGYLKIISEAAQRGGQLVDDLLAFSRLGRAELKRKTVDLNRLVRDVRAELAPDQEGRSVEWRVPQLPPVEADPALLRLVLKNLIGNALKYSRPRADAVIEVGAQARPDDVEIWVRDNGVGFDMRYVDKLFGVFQRLHTNEQFEGTGIGLALVRRIVGRHGGRTWATGKVGEGAQITFTLPSRPPAS